MIVNRRSYCFVEAGYLRPGDEYACNNGAQVHQVVSLTNDGSTVTVTVGILSSNNGDFCRQWRTSEGVSGEFTFTYDLYEKFILLHRPD